MTNKIAHIFLILVLSFFISVNGVWAADHHIYPFDNKAQKTRFYHMLNELRCLVCQNQNLADSNAKLAMDLKNIVYKKITANESDKAIKLFLTKRYGDYVLFKPPVNMKTSLLWFLPLIFLAMAMLALFRFILRKE